MRTAGSTISDATAHGPPPELRYLTAILDKPNHPSSATLIDVWRAHEAHGGMRVGRDLPSRVLAPLLPRLALLVPIEDWKDARVRLVGTSLSVYLHGDLSGVLFNDLYGRISDSRTLLLCARRAQHAREPAILDARVIAGRAEVMHCEIVMMSVLASDGQTTLSLVGSFRY